MIHDSTGTEEADAATAHLTAVLHALAGPEARPRDDQLVAVRALVGSRARVLLVQATGWGKSAVYWAATAALRAEGAGMTLVVSPLLALMRDQVAAAQRAGLRATTINSTNFDEWDEVLTAVAAGDVDVLLVSPERLSNPRFASRLPSLLENAGMIVIDEAHCISDWGFDFRPDYQRLSRVLLRTAPNTPVLATTATANNRVTEDVASQLGADTVTLRGSLARVSLDLAVVPGLGPLERYAWVADALSGLAGSGIVYMLTVAETERLADFLTAQGFPVAAYSGRTPDDDRRRIEGQLRDNLLKAVVATSALGMGYDKPDLAFCIHVGSPSSPVAYYQQVGRAGRSLDTAVAVLLPAETDPGIWDYFATSSIPDPEHAAATLRAATGEARSVVALEEKTGIRRGRLDALLKILAVDGAVERTPDGWIATGAPWEYDAAKYDGVVAARRTEADLMRAYAHGEGCLMEFLQRALDDPDPGPCGRCSVCTGRLPPPGQHPSPERVLAARELLRGRDVIIEPRLRWPGGLGSERRGKIVSCSEGRALAYADDPAWRDEMTAFDGPDRDVGPGVADGMVALMARWRGVWAARPIAVVAMPSRTHPRRVRSIAEHLGAVGKLPLLDVLDVSGAPVASDLASAKRADGLFEQITVRADAAVPDGPVLLVDDTYRSGWTMTVAGALLREAGASAVLPLVVHRRA
jgi:ATP-dependent DNA helicase RecQ